MSEDRLDRESLLDEINRLLPDPIRDETQLDGESEKSKCQIETLIGLTSPIRGAGRFQRHPHKRNPKPNSATAGFPSLTSISEIGSGGI